MSTGVQYLMLPSVLTARCVFVCACMCVCTSMYVCFDSSIVCSCWKTSPPDDKPPTPGHPTVECIQLSLSLTGYNIFISNLEYETMRSVYVSVTFVDGLCVVVLFAYCFLCWFHYLIYLPLHNCPLSFYTLSVFYPSPISNPCLPMSLSFHLSSLSLFLRLHPFLPLPPPLPPYFPL